MIWLTLLSFLTQLYPRMDEWNMKDSRMMNDLKPRGIPVRTSILYGDDLAATHGQTEYRAIQNQRLIKL